MKHTFTLKHGPGDRVAWWCDDLGRIVRSTIAWVEADIHRDGTVVANYWTKVKMWGRRVPACFTDKDVRYCIQPDSHSTGNDREVSNA